jgi:hypothetical protein
MAVTIKQVKKDSTFFGDKIGSFWKVAYGGGKFITVGSYGQMAYSY